MRLFVHSGKCRLCAVGTATACLDLHGKPLFTGDIVLTFTGDYVPANLTVVVRDECRSFTGGAHLPVDEPGPPFAMGIKSVALEDTGEWSVLKVKDFSDVVPGEHWSAYGFNYQADTPRDSDGSPEGGDGEAGSVRSTTARAEGIAK